jgi:branched-chain amino acid transport system permease protein
MQLLIQTLVSGLAVGAMYSLIAVGFSIILGTLKVVDFTYGAYVVVAAFATFWASQHLFTGGGVLDAVLSILFATLLTAAIGTFIWGVLLRGLLDSTHLSQLVGTIGAAVIIAGIVLSAFGTDVVLTKFESAQRIVNLGPVYVSSGRIAAGVIGVLVLLGFMALLNTRVGLMIRGTAMDAKGAAVVGIDIARIRLLTVALGAGLGGLAGGLLIMFLPVGPADSNRFILIAFFTVAVGGLGSLRGSMLAAFLIAMVEIFSQTYAPNIIKNAIPFLVVAGFIILMPQGLASLRLRLWRR